MQIDIITPSDVARYLIGFAQRFADASNTDHLTELAVTASVIPGPLLADLSAKFAQLDPAIVASVLSVRAREIAVDGLRYDDATDFVRALEAELQRYLDEPEVTAAALAELQRVERASMH
jgi:hypothetical protein